MLEKLKVCVCCLALCIAMAVQVNASESAGETASAFDPQVDGVLKAAGEYLKSQKGVAMKAETLLDIVNDDGQVVTYTVQLDLSMVRPDKLYLKRVGVIRNQEIFYNGSELVIHSLQHNVYAKAEVPSTIGEMLDFATAELNVQVPGSDLLRSDLYDGMRSEAISGAYLGKVMIDGVDCHHLAYQGAEVDFQLWIEAEDEPKPKRFMIISKGMTAAPRFMLNIINLEPAEFGKEIFEFTPPAGEKRIRFLTEHEVEQVKQTVKESK